MYLNTERYDDAIDFYQNELLKRNPKDDKAMQSLAMLYFKKGDFDNGVKWLKKRLNVDTTNPEPRGLLPDRRAGVGPLVQLPRHRSGRAGARSSTRDWPP